MKSSKSTRLVILITLSEKRKYHQQIKTRSNSKMGNFYACSEKTLPAHVFLRFIFSLVACLLLSKYLHKSSSWKIHFKGFVDINKSKNVDGHSIQFLLLRAFQDL